MEAIAPAPGDRLITQQAAKKANHVSSDMTHLGQKIGSRPHANPLEKKSPQNFSAIAQ
ncbi:MULTISPECIES: hypothetical protein [unclassified Pseudomonas]|uniref:hypothetical protein n=1 Tax=unclassified Pseudomonas TaxID=196821 RepID=UPI0015B180F0|nr:MULTISPECIES: hypothetical protein [unclassified Pseudomonas]MCU1725068.1 hypothetical protein [Pseudomonas sp. 5P_5.1_Bac1]